MSYKDQLGAMARGLIGNLTRSEELHIEMHLNPRLAQKYREELKKSPFNMPDDADGENIRVTYSLAIEYWGGIVDALSTVEKLLDDPGVVKTVSTKELTHGRCMIQGILSKLERIERKHG